MVEAPCQVTRYTGGNGQRKNLQARTVKNLSRALEVRVSVLLGIDD